MDPLQILFFVFLFILSAFFSWTEIALMSLASHKIESLVRQNKFWAKALKNIKDKNDRLLITILIWNNLVNVFTASYATTISIAIAENSGLEQSLAIWISTWVVTFLLLMFGEIAPKTFATQNAEKIALIVAKPYEILMYILFPVVFIIEIIIKLFSKNSSDDVVTNEEIEAFIDLWKSSWTLEASEHEKIKSVLEFSERSVDEIMIPRVSIEALEENTTVWEAINYALNHTHSRIPVYAGTIDNIGSIVTIRQLLEEKMKDNENKKLKDIWLSNVIKVPLNQRVDTLLETFKKSFKHMAIIIDEYGWVAGLVTLEDVIEEVFWDIKDETDKEIEEIKKVWNNTYILHPNVIINDVLALYDLDFSDVWLDEKEIWWETISYVITHDLERFPSPWESIMFNIKSDEDEKNSEDEISKVLKIKVTNISNFKINRVEVTIKE